MATLGALSAVILLIFKDTLLGFVASIQVTINDTVRIGDWISMQSYNADGDVIEINLSTVKVQNFDNTITTIPTYAFISESFKNWRGMTNSGGRRIKRALHLKQESIKYLTVEEVDKLTGPVIGRPKSATFRTIDVVGLDTLVHTANGVKDNCPEDEMRDQFVIPDFVNTMIENKWLGSKTKQGF